MKRMTMMMIMNLMGMIQWINSSQDKIMHIFMCTKVDLTYDLIYIRKCSSLLNKRPTWSFVQVNG